MSPSRRRHAQPRRAPVRCSSIDECSPWTELDRGKNRRRQESGSGDPVNGSRWAPLKMQAGGATWKGMTWSLCGFPSMWWPREHSPQAGWPVSHAWLTGEAGGTDGGGLVQLPQAARLHLGRHSQERPTTAWRGGQHGCGHVTDARDRHGGVLTTVRRTGGQQVCAEAGKGAPRASGEE